MGATPPLPTKGFDFSNVSVTWGAFSLNGGLKSIKVARAGDAWATEIAADGTVTRIKNNDRTGGVVLVYGQNAPMLDVLSQQAQLDEATGTAIYQIEVHDGNGRSIAKAPSAWIKKIPDAEYQKEGSDREVEMSVDQLTHFVGGLT